jgi:hypothetical protein
LHEGTVNKILAPKSREIPASDSPSQFKIKFHVDPAIQDRIDSARVQFRGYDFAMDGSSFPTTEIALKLISPYLAIAVLLPISIPGKP